MTDSSVDDFLNKPLGAIEKPKLVPPGTWLGTIFTHKIELGKKVGKNSTETYNSAAVYIRLVQPDKDVDPALLAEFSVKGAPPVTREFRMDAQGQWQFRKFAETFSIPNAAQAPIKALLPLLHNRNVVFMVKHKAGSTPGDDGEIPMFVNISDLKALP
jgi:hypothetical protein